MGSLKVGDQVTTTAVVCQWALENDETEGRYLPPPGTPLFVYMALGYYGDYDADNYVWLEAKEPEYAEWCWLVPINSVIPAGGTHASLERVFALAVAQSRDGKGADRHGNGKPFEEQPIVRDIAELGSNHGAISQVRKKALESTRLAATGRKDMALAELLGAMVYAGAAYLILEADNG